MCEGTSHGEHQDGPWRAGVPEWAAGRWCDVFEIRDWKIQRCFIYLDPDYAGKDTDALPVAGGADLTGQARVAVTSTVSYGYSNDPPIASISAPTASHSACRRASPSA